MTRGTLATHVPPCRVSLQDSRRLPTPEASDLTRKPSDAAFLLKKSHPDENYAKNIASYLIIYPQGGATMAPEPPERNPTAGTTASMCRTYIVFIFT